MLLVKISCRHSGGFDPPSTPLHFLLSLHGSQRDVLPRLPFGNERTVLPFDGSAAGGWLSVLFEDCLEL